MANLAMKPQDPNKTTTQPKSEIAGNEHSAAAAVGHHVAPPPATLQGLKAIPVSTPSNQTDLFPLARNLQQRLISWQPAGPDASIQLALKQRVSKALNDISVQQNFEQEVEQAETLGMRADPSSPSAPSLEILREDLMALAAFGSTLPGPVAAAVEKFQQEFARCFPAEQPVHPAPHARHNPALDAAPAPQED